MEINKIASLPDNPAIVESQLQERFVRWQDTLRQTLSAHVTLILSLSSGGLAYVGSILSDKNENFISWYPYIVAISGVLFTCSLGLGIFISFFRLRDVRKTLKIINFQRDNTSDEIIDELRTQAKNIGICIWRLLYWQLVVFAIAVAFLSGGILSNYGHRLLFSEKVHKVIPNP